MAIPQSKRVANDEWDKANMTTLGCKVKKEDASAFKEYCTEKGKTSNAGLKKFVTKCISGDKSDESTSKEGE